MIRFGTVDVDGDIVYNHERCKIKINNGEFEKGSLFMTSSEICWKRENSENGFIIPWEKVTVQAISNEPQRCVYFMIDVKWPESSNGNHSNDDPEEQNGSEDEGNESEGSVQELTEFFVVPESENEIEELYYVMTKFPEAAPMDDDSDNEFFDGEHMDQMNINEDDDPDRFADAE